MLSARIIILIYCVLPIFSFLGLIIWTKYRDFRELDGRWKRWMDGQIEDHPLAEEKI